MNIIERELHHSLSSDYILYDIDEFYKAKKQTENSVLKSPGVVSTPEAIT